MTVRTELAPTQDPTVKLLDHETSTPAPTAEPAPAQQAEAGRTGATAASAAQPGLGGPVAYVLKMYPRFSETFIVNEILAHEAAGMDVHVFSLRPPSDGRFHPALAEVRASVTYVDRKDLSPSELWRRLRAAAEQFPTFAASLDDLFAADVEDAAQAISIAAEAVQLGVVHLHAHFGSVATTVARLVSKLTGLPFTFTAHAKDIYHHDVDPTDLRAKLTDTAACVTVSDFNAHHLGTLTDDTSRIVRIYNGLHLDRFPYTDPTDRPPHVVAVGRLVEKKGFGDLIRAMGLLRDAGRSITCSIVGAGALEDELRVQIERAGLSSLVTLAGPRPQHEVVRAVTRAAVMVAPCVVGADGNRDGMPTVLLESMALGTPVVATPVTGVPELISDDRDGLLVPERDPEALAVAISRLVDDPSLRQRLAAEARRSIEVNFDITRQAAQLRRVFLDAQPADAQPTVAQTDRPQTIASADHEREVG